MQARVWPEGELAAAGFGGILAVGSGSTRPPRLIELSYQPAWRGRARPALVLVGKGITFDSGGLSLKPNDGMKSMKTDMSGGAVVIAVLSALAGLGVPLPGHRAGRRGGEHALGIGVPARRRDHPLRRPDGGGAQHRRRGTPGAGRRHWPTRSRRSSPTQIIDVATLTGAARVALGTTHAAAVRHR